MREKLSCFCGLALAALCVLVLTVPASALDNQVGCATAASSPELVAIGLASDCSSSWRCKCTCEYEDSRGNSQSKRLKYCGPSDGSEPTADWCNEQYGDGSTGCEYSAYSGTIKKDSCTVVLVQSLHLLEYEPGPQSLLTF